MDQKVNRKLIASNSVNSDIEITDSNMMDNEGEAVMEHQSHVDMNQYDNELNSPNYQFENESEEQDELVKYNMNFSSLNEYLNNIIKVVNQHAKLLNTLN